MKGYYYFYCHGCENDWHYTKDELRNELGPTLTCRYCELTYCEECFGDSYQICANCEANTERKE